MASEPTDQQETARAARARGERLMPTVEFNALLRQEARRAGEMMQAAKPAQFAPRLAMALDHGARQAPRKWAVMQLAALPDGEEKHKALFVAGVQAAAKGFPAVAAFLSSEAWLKTMSPAEGWRAKSKPIPAPSQCPDRTEALIVFGSTLDGRLNMAVADIRRDGPGTPRLGSWKFKDYGGGAEELLQHGLLKYFFAGHFLWMKAGEEKGK